MGCACAQVWWTRAQRQWQWAQTVVTALVVGCCELDSTTRSGHERAQAAAGLRAQWRAGHKSGGARALAMKRLMVGALSREPGLGCWSGSRQGLKAWEGLEGI